MKPRYIDSIRCSVSGCGAEGVALEMIDKDRCRTHAVEWCEAGHVVAMAPPPAIKCGAKLVFDFTGEMSVNPNS